MHLIKWIVLLLDIISVANCYSTLDEISQDYGPHRDSKRLNGPISRQRGRITGTLKRQRNGPCAAITEHYEGGDVTIMDNGGLFYSPKQPTQRRRTSSKRYKQRQMQRNASKERIFTAELCPKKSVVQFEINIINLDLKAPVNGKCTDKLEITGVNEGLQVPELCGKVTNQTLYIDIDNSDGPYEIIIKTLGYDEKERESSSMSSSSGSKDTNITPFWIINIRFLNRDEAVPRGCLQYQWTPNGTLQSFNFGSQAMSEISHTSLINQRYAICFADIVGHCDIEFNITRFDLGEMNGDCNNDYLLIGDDKYCGDMNNTIVIADSSGPIFVNVRMDGNNSAQDMGFYATYTRMPCGINAYTTPSKPTIMSSEIPETTHSPSTTTPRPSTTTAKLPKTTDDTLNFYWLR